MYLTPDIVEALNIGSHFLGAGGGEDCFDTKVMFKFQITEKQKLPLITLQELNKTDLVAIISFLGCPLVETEKTANTLHFQQIVKQIEISYDRPLTGIVPASAGGGTFFLPFFIASHFNLPIIDADCFGRCIPELSSLSTNFFEIQPQKAFIFNLMGIPFTLECKNFFNLERHARQIAISSGGGCVIVPQVLTGEEARRGLIAGSVTKTLTIGKIIQETRDLQAVMDYVNGKIVGIGGVMATTGVNLPPPFKRHIVLKNIREQKVWEVWMDNEFNLLLENGKVIAEVPDIITLCDPFTCEPVTLKNLRANANVVICTMPAPHIWYTERGLSLVRSPEYRRATAALPRASIFDLDRIA